jgi:hypothetical protein
LKDSNLAMGSECEAADIPTLETIKTKQYVLNTGAYSIEAAASLNIGPIASSGDLDTKLVVRDFKRSVECLTTDGKFIKEYGQIIRNVLKVSTTDASVGLDYAIIAAKGSLNQSSSTNFFLTNGIGSPKLREVFQANSGVVLKVENFGEIEKAFKDAQALVFEPDAVQSVELLSQRLAPTDLTLRQAAASTYALQQISQRRSCARALRLYPDNLGNTNSIEDVYYKIMGVCSTDRPDSDHRKEAENFLID